jgi:hypothetical protein
MPGRPSASPYHDQHRWGLLEFLSRLRNSVNFVGGLDLAKPYTLGDGRVDVPPNSARHVLLPFLCSGGSTTGLSATDAHWVVASDEQNICRSGQNSESRQHGALHSTLSGQAVRSGLGKEAGKAPI